jgi:hypothetical protein
VSKITLRVCHNELVTTPLRLHLKVTRFYEYISSTYYSSQNRRTGDLVQHARTPFRKIWRALENLLSEQQSLASGTRISPLQATGGCLGLGSWAPQPSDWRSRFVFERFRIKIWLGCNFTGWSFRRFFQLLLANHERMFKISHDRYLPPAFSFIIQKSSNHSMPLTLTSLIKI